MSDKPELPREGGSYVRQKDGALKRAGEIAPPAPTPAPAADTKAKE